MRTPNPLLPKKYRKQAAVARVLDPETQYGHPVFTDLRAGFVCLHRDTMVVLSSEKTIGKCMANARLALLHHLAKSRGKAIGTKVVFQVPEGESRLNIGPWRAGVVESVHFEPRYRSIKPQYLIRCSSTGATFAAWEVLRGDKQFARKLNQLTNAEFRAGKVLDAARKKFNAAQKGHELN